MEQDNYVYPGQRLASNGYKIGYGQGMTLRDWFAGQALAGYFANPNTPHMNAADEGRAQYCYQMADAMLEARK